MIARLVPCLLMGLVISTAVVCCKGEEPRYSYIGGHTAFGGNPEMRRGFADAMFMYRDDRPVIGFGMQKRMNDPGRYLYILLFSPDVPKMGFTVSASGKTEGDSADVTSSFTFRGSKLEIAYAFVAEKDRIKSEQLKINGQKYSAEAPPVFLIELAGEKAKLTPVKVKVTTTPPDISDEKRLEMPFVLGATIDALKKESPEIAQFLDKK